jgi:mono/diheme cytochrome c family protein
MMRRGSGIAIGVLLVLVMAGVAGSASLLRHGLSARDEPTAIEAYLARKMRHWATPAGVRVMTNPVPLTPEVLAEARAHFADHCAACHGNDGKGKTEMGQHMYPRAPDMTQRQTQTLSDGELYAIVENGIRLTGMPGWSNGSAEAHRASWTLVHFIRHLPKITTEEVAEMEKVNPKTPEEYEELKREQEFLEGGTPAAQSGHSMQHSH